MANSRGYGVRGIQRIMTAPIATGASFVAGDFIKFTTGGAVIASAAGANYVPTGNDLLGRALNGTAADPNAFNGAAPTSVQFIVAEPGTEFEVPNYHTTPASSVPTMAQQGTSYALRNSATGFPQTDLTDTTNLAVRVIEPDPKDCSSWDVGSVAAGVQFASQWVEFIGSVCKMTGAR